MEASSDLDDLRQELHLRFEPPNPIAAAIVDKLADAMHKQRRCEHLLDYSRRLTPERMRHEPREKVDTVLRNIQKLRDTVRDCRRLVADYQAALRIQSQLTQNASANAGETNA